MRTWKTLSATCSTLVVAGGLTVAPLLTGPAIAAELLSDGGFEASAGSGDSPAWTETDSIFGSPICDAGCGGVGARSGDWWVWFGGSVNPQTGSISQSVTIPAGGAALSFYLWRSSNTSPKTATLTVKVDAVVVKTYDEVTDPDWAQRVLDLSAFEGGTHTLSFNYVNPEVHNNSVNFHLDDVSLTTGHPTTTVTPTVTGITPAGPSSSTDPQVTGTSEPGSTVTLYANAACTGAPLGTGSAAEFASPGITVTVPTNTTTTIHAQASTPGQVDSACSATSASYTHDSVVPGQVTVSGVTPTSPNISVSPAISGTAEPGSTVKLFKTPDCTGPPAQAGSAADFAAPGLLVSVGPNSTTTVKATATDAAGNTSECSGTSVTYVNDVAPPAPVTLGNVSPASPSSSTSPVVRGTAEAGSTVKIFTSSDCSGSPAQTGTATAFNSPGLVVGVGGDSSTTFKATATDAAGNTSTCSTSSVTYVNDSTPPGLVTVTGVTPSSPNPSTTPVVQGSAEAGSTVKLFTTADCSGSPAATGAAAAFGSSGLTVPVATGSTNTFRATATDPAGNASACSTSSVTYVQQGSTPPPATVPDTTLGKTPKKKVTTTKSKAKVSFEFSSTTAGATFQCSIDGGTFTACASGQGFKLKVGKHTFAVRAVAGGQVDPTPATYAVKVKRKRVNAP